MRNFPAAARVACWLNAWIAGRESADEVIAGVVGEHARVAFNAPDNDDAWPPALVLGELRRRAVRRVSVCLPRPGDPLGLGGPPPFNADALEAGEAMIWHGADLGFVPAATGAALWWHTASAFPPLFLPDVPSADRELRSGLIRTADALADLDVVAWSPDLADELLNLRAKRADPPALPFATSAAAAMAATALRCLTIVELAGRTDGGAVSACEATARRNAITPLEAAARGALVAACSAPG